MQRVKTRHVSHTGNSDCVEAREGEKGIELTDLESERKPPRDILGREREA